MPATNSSAPGARRSLSGRRLALLGSVAVLGIGVLMAAPGIAPQPGFALSNPAFAAATTGPAGFADIVAKVKPAVISVRVKVDQGSKLSGLSRDDGDFSLRPGSPFDRFFRQFGLPQMPQGRQMVTGQGSGFFISADGYAVTNNHVVDKAESVEVTTDDGSTYTAKVIGTDPKTDLALIKVEGRRDFAHV